MKQEQSLLDNIQIAKPCQANWEEMSGDERSRACQLCHLNVYNISNMSRNEAVSFLRERLPQDRVCVRLYRRADGTVITDNCPKGLRAARDAAQQLTHRIAASISLMLAMVTGGIAQSQTCSKDHPSPVMMGKPAVRLMGEPAATQAVTGRVMPVTLMGTPAPITKVSPTDNYLTGVRAKIANDLELPKGCSIKVSFDINADGTVRDLKIIQSSGNKHLDHRALNKVRSAAPFEKIASPKTTPLPVDYTFK